MPTMASLLSGLAVLAFKLGALILGAFKLGAFILLASTVGVLALGAIGADAAEEGPYGFGTTPSEAEIAALDIDVGPDGRGLPVGTGTAGAGEAIYAEKCAACHGADLEGIPAAGVAPLIGGRGTLAGPSPLKTVESYWPCLAEEYRKALIPSQVQSTLSLSRPLSLSLARSLLSLSPSPFSRTLFLPSLLVNVPPARTCCRCGQTSPR